MPNRYEYRPKRFPCRPNEYSKIVGGLLTKIIAEILNQLEFRTEVNVTDKNDVNIKIYWNNNLIIVGEALNWSIATRLTEERRQQIINNLFRYNNRCRKAIFHSVSDSINRWSFPRGIDFICIGFQILPQEFYDFFWERGIVDQREPLTSETREEIQETIEEYLRAHDFL